MHLCWQSVEQHFIPSLAIVVLKLQIALLNGRIFDPTNDQQNKIKPWL